MRAKNPITKERLSAARRSLTAKAGAVLVTLSVSLILTGEAVNIHTLPFEIVGVSVSEHAALAASLEKTVSEARQIVIDMLTGLVAGFAVAAFVLREQKEEMRREVEKNEELAEALKSMAESMRNRRAEEDGKA